MRILVSACLLGCNCRYDGSHRASEKVAKLRENHELIPVCPEQLGGLATPRLPSEIVGDQVLAQDGSDVSLAFQRGAHETLKLARLLGCETAVLKSLSPSCGYGEVYDGTFTGGKRPGKGVTAALLEHAGLRILTEEQMEGL